MATNTASPTQGVSKSLESWRGKMWRVLTVTWKGFAAAVVLACTVAGTMFTLHAGPFAPVTPDGTSLAKTYDNTNPERSCVKAGETTTISRATLYQSGTKTAIGTVQVMHSSTCDTSWIRVQMLVDGATVRKHLARPVSEGLAANAVTTSDVSDLSDPTNAFTYSYQLYAPGCIYADVQILDANGALLGGYPKTKSC